MGWKKIELKKTYQKIKQYFFDKWEEEDFVEQNPYNIQNMLMVEYDMPNVIFIWEGKNPTKKEGDEIGSIYLDRIGKNCVYPYERMSKQEFFEFVKEIVGKEVSGARMVRFTNVATGYPTPRLDYFIKGKDSPKQKTTIDFNF